MTISTDIETALYNLLIADNYSASAHTIPSTLGNALPHVHVTRTGGYTADRVMEFNNIDFDVYSGTPAEAMAAAVTLCGWVRDLEGNLIETPCYSSEITTLPYNNPDPRHLSLGRTTFKAQITIRNKEV